MVTQRQPRFVGLTLAMSLLTTLLGQAEVLQVSGTVSGWSAASIAGSIDTSGLSANQLDVHVESLDPNIPAVWYAFEVVRPLLWNGAARVGNASNYWDVWASNYGGNFWTGGQIVAQFSVNTSGTFMTYNLDWNSVVAQPPADVVAVRSCGVHWIFYSLRAGPGGTGCSGWTEFGLGTGASYWEQIYELIGPQPGALDGGKGILTWSWIREVEPDVWRFSWTAAVPEPSALLLALVVATAFSCCRRATARRRPGAR